MAKKMSYQKAQAATGSAVDEPTVSAEEAEDEGKTGPTLVEKTAWGGIYQSTFSITVNKQVKNPETGKMEEAVAYENTKEPFTFPRVDSLVNALIHAGAKLTEAQIDAFGESLGEENGASVVKLIKVYNDKIRGDAKTSAYQGLVSKHKPLEGQDREVAIAKTIRGFVKLAGISVDTAIEVLKSKKAVPEDYTVEDYNATKMRKTRGADEDEE